jgi:hypothetical protein
MVVLLITKGWTGCALSPSTCSALGTGISSTLVFFNSADVITPAVGFPILPDIDLVPLLALLFLLSILKIGDHNRKYPQRMNPIPPSKDIGHFLLFKGVGSALDGDFFGAASAFLAIRH